MIRRPLPWLRDASTAGFVAFLLLFSAVVVAATVYHLYYLRHNELQRVQELAASHARVFEGHLTQSLNLIDLTLRNLQESRPDQDVAAWREGLARALWRAPYLRSLSLLAGDGSILASSEADNAGRAPPLEGLLPDLAASTSTLRLGLPWSGRDFADGRVATPEQPGRPDGIGFVPLLRANGSVHRLLAALNPDYFLNQFAGILGADEGRVEVRRLDGILLFGSDAGTSSALPGTQAGTTVEPDGDFLMADRASPLYPLSVAVFMQRQPALLAWRSQMHALLTVVVPTFLLSLGLATLTFRQVRRLGRERQEQTLRDHDRLAGRVFEASAEAIIVTDRDNRIVRVNPAYTRLSGYTDSEVIGRNPSINRSGKQDSEFYRQMWQDLKARGAWKGEVVNRRRDGLCYPAALTISEVRNPAGEVVNYVALLTDISELKAREDRIRFLSEHDVLTGLPNRTLFQDRVMQAMAQSRRSGRRLALLFIDLDRFKPINDTYGHHVGDQLLQEVARRLTAAVRESDTVARQGGDEFLIMLAAIEHPSAAAQVAGKLMQVVGAPYLLGGRSLQVTPSIGISLYPDDATELGALIQAADTAMYFSKSRGRSAFHFYSSDLQKTANDRLGVEAGLRRALEKRAFALHYQPLTRVADGQVVGTEALLRWHDQNLGQVPPDRFIPVAEEAGLIAAIGEWVLREACRQMRQWLDEGCPPLRIAVNVSALQFAREGFTDSVLQALADHGLEGSILELEVTETTLMRQDEEHLERFAALREAGVSLVIDDFGTGYSSLSYLRRLPVDKIKIDRSFISDVITDAEDARIVASLIDMAHGIGLRVLGEGVETPEQLEFLRERSCYDLQGFLVSRPLPSPDLIRGLESRVTGDAGATKER